MKKTLLISALALLCSATINAKILRVNNNVGVSVDYTDIKDSYEAASDGDTLYIEFSSVCYQMPKRSE